MLLKGKKILVVGMARSGISVSKVLNKLGAYVIMNDLKKETELQSIIQDVEKYVHEFILGEHVKDFSNIDLVVLSPGVPLNIEPVRLANENGIEVIGELELAYRLLDGKFIGITGTNGKTTTTALVGLMFENANIDSHVVGNIGLPVISKMFDSKDETFLITEISSFQLETIRKFRPKISAILNITPDHLNRHKTMENYIEAKSKIFMNQGEHDYLVLNYDNDVTRKIGENSELVNCIYFSRKEKLHNGIYLESNTIYLMDDGEKIKIIDREDIFILGDHSVENAMAAIAIAYYSGIPVSIIKKSLMEFRSVEHRIEFVKEIENVKYYNDSKATNPDAAIVGIKAMENKTILIAGGMDKGSDFKEFIENFNDKIKMLVLFGETKNIIKNQANSLGYENVKVVSSLKEAVNVAYTNAKENESVLLSPACASWDMYDSFEHRGREFKELVLKLGV